MPFQSAKRRERSVDRKREFRGKTGEDVAGKGEEVWVCFTIYKGKLILCELFDSANPWLQGQERGW